MNKRNWKVLSLLAFGILFLSACRVVRGSGDIVKESRTVSNFDSVFLSGTGDVIITQDGQESLTIESDDNVMQYITSEVRGGTLYLGVQEWTSILTPRIIFAVGVDDITGVDISGSGDIEANNIETDRMEVGVSGSGNIRLIDVVAKELAVKISGSGNVETTGEVAGQQIVISGSGEHEGRNLNSKTTTVKISGSGNATVWATDSLDARVSGSGSVDYYGNPRVILTSSGSGDVNSKGER